MNTSLTNQTDEQVKRLYPGNKGTVEFDGLTFVVVIKDARKRFGHLDFLVTPEHGTGERWIQSNRVRLSPFITERLSAAV